MKMVYCLGKFFARTRIPIFIWKIGTLKCLIKRALLVCSDQTSLEKEIKHLKFVFTLINKYPLKIVDKTLREVWDKFETGVSNDIKRGQDKDNARIGTRTRKHYTDCNLAVFRHGKIAKHVMDDSNFNILALGVWNGTGK